MGATERCTPAASERQAGIALVVALVIVVGLTVLAHGALVLAGGEAAAARAFERATHERLRSRTWVQASLRAVSGDSLPATPVGGVDTVALGADRLRLLERIDREYRLLEVVSRGGAAGTVVGPRSAALLWAADPLRRVGSVSAVVSSGGARAGGGAIVSDGFFDGPAEGEEWCGIAVQDLDSLRGARPPPDPVGPLDLDAGPESSVSPSTAALTLGRLGPDSLAVRLRAHPAGIGTPGSPPAVFSCLEGPLNWGTPTAPDGPCGNRWIALRVDGSLTLDGGEGQGVVVVTGDLTLRAGAVLAGVVLVGGRLRLEGDAMIRGLVQVGDAVTVSAGSRVVGSACAAAAALTAAVALRRPVRVPGPLTALR